MMELIFVKRTYILIRKMLWVMIVVFFLCFLLLALFSNLVGAAISAMGSFFFGYFLIHAIFEKEEKNNGFQLLIAMPYERRTIIKNFYSIVIGGAIIAWGMISLLGLLIASIQKINWSFVGGGIVFGIEGIFFGILLPICFKYHYQKAVLCSQVFLFSFAMIFVLLSKSSRISWERIATIYSGWYDVAGIFIGILAFFLSYLVSKAIFEARDF